MSGFWGWLFSFHDRHFRDGYNYSKNALGRVIALMTQILFIGIGLGLEYWSMTLWGGDNFVAAFLVTLFAFGVVVTAIEYSLVYAIFGFICAITGTLEGFLAKASDKKKKKRAENEAKLDAQKAKVTNGTVENASLENMVYGDTSEADAKAVELEERRRAKKLKWLDLFVGIFSVALAIGTLVAGFLILAYAVDGKI